MKKTKKQRLKKVTKEQIRRGAARHNHLRFMKHTWMRSDENLKVGIHTKATCDVIDTAFKRFREGKSTFLEILICFRHGKSDMVSRYLPPHFLGEFPDKEVIVTSHNAEVAHEFSRDSREIVKSDMFADLYPHVQLDPNNAGIESWGINQRKGKARWFGIQAGSAGKGGSLIIIDDYHGSRKDAESEKTRSKVIQSFKNDIMTRRADPCIVIVCVTPWHVADLVGYIDKAKVKNKRFPQFAKIRFPAFSKKYPTGMLFPERFSEDWYESHKATLSQYEQQSLMQCDPAPRASNRLRVDKIKYYDELPPGMILKRAWDLASSSKEQMKDDPDYTVGGLGGMVFIPTDIQGKFVCRLYIEDIVRGQWKGPKRNEIITNTALSGSEQGTVVQGIEAFGAYKDAYEELSSILSGLAVIEKMNLPGDKLAKANCLELPFESGNVYFKKGAPWIDELIEEIRLFPLGPHDDQVDTLAILFNMCKYGGVPFYTTEQYNKEKAERDKREKESLEKNGIKNNSLYTLKNGLYQRKNLLIAA